MTALTEVQRLVAREHSEGLTIRSQLTALQSRLQEVIAVEEKRATELEVREKQVCVCMYIYTTKDLFCGSYFCYMTVI